MQYCDENDWQDFFKMCCCNAQRASKLLSDAADDLLPEAALTATLQKDVFDVLLHNVRPSSPPAAPLTMRCRRV